MQDDIQQSPPDADGVATGEERKALSVEIAGEIILLSAVAVFFAFIIADSTGIIGSAWPMGAALTPWIAVGIGIPFLIARIIHVARVALWVGQAPEVPKAQIMDVGFRVGDDPPGERRRFVRVLVAIGVLYVGIWLVGFHIMVPLWIFGYMYWYGNMRLWTAAIMGLLFLALIFGVYDGLMQTPWHQPVLFEFFSN